MATRPEQLYEEDFYAWTRDQAKALRRLAATRPNVDLDFEHLIEEVADLGISQRDAVRSQLRGSIEHCLKLEYFPALAPPVGWHETIIDARIVLEDKLTRTLRRASSGACPSSSIRRGAPPPPPSGSTASQRGVDALPAECPYRLADLLRHDWYPRSRYGLEP